jgi:hypothetical protein
LGRVVKWWEAHKERRRTRDEQIRETAYNIAQLLIGSEPKLMYEIFEEVDPPSEVVAMWGLIKSKEWFGVRCTVTHEMFREDWEGPRKLTYYDYKYFVPDGGTELPIEIPPLGDGIPTEQEFIVMEQLLSVRALEHVTRESRVEP